MNRRESLMAMLTAPLVGADASQLLGTLSAVDEKSTQRVFAKWWCQLNTWKWPPDWGTQPQWVAEMLAIPYREQSDEHKQKYHLLMDALEAVATRKECLRYWNVCLHPRMTEREFEDWWKENNP